MFKLVSVRLICEHGVFGPLQEVECAYGILCKEGARLSGGLGQLVPVALYPGRLGLNSCAAEEQANSRRVFLSHSQAEDMFWAVDSLNFVIDTGMERKYVSRCFFSVGMMKLAVCPFNQISASHEAQIYYQLCTPPSQWASHASVNKSRSVSLICCTRPQLCSTDPGS